MIRFLIALVLLAPAATPPRSTLQVTALSYTPGATLTAPPTTLTITLNAPPDPTSVNLASVVLVRAGPDQTLGTADDLVITPNSLTLSGNQIVMDLSGLTLPNDQYRLTVRGNDLSIPNLVNWWKLDEGSGTTVSDSAGAITGTFGGGGGTSPTWTTGRLGGGLNFAGNDNRVAFGAGNIPVPWTAAMWVNRQDAPTVDARLIDGLTSSLRLEQFNGTKKVGVTVPGSVDTAFVYTAPIGQWTHLTFVGQSTGTTLYVNGAWVQDVGTALGCPRNTLGSDGFNSMVGILDDVRLFSGKLTQNEITAIAGLGGAVRDGSENPLDGEFSGSFPSGNGTSGGDFVADFTLSAPPPRILSMTPAPGSSVPAPSTISIVTDSPLDPATVSGATVTVVRAGPDGLLGTLDDVVIPPASISVSGGTTLVIGLPGSLPPDLYQVRASGTTSALPSPANYWPLDEGVGTTAMDISGGLNGTLGGNGGTLPSWTNGKVGSCLSFGGTDYRVSLGGTDLPAPWTTALWVYRLTSQKEDSRLTDSLSYSLRLEQFNFTRHVGVTIYGSTDAPFAYIAPVGQWIHLAFVGTAGGTSLYVNGTFSETISTAVGCPRTTLGSVGYNSMVGMLDEVHVYNTALPASQIQLLASLGGALRSTGSILLDGDFTGTFPSGNGVAGGDFVATFTISSGIPSPPPPPLNLTAQAGNQQVLLTWTASSGATSYNVQRGTTSGSEVTIAPGVTSPGFTDFGGTNGTTYFYVVTAVNAQGESSPSAEVQATPLAPSAASSLIAGGCGGTGMEALLVLGALWGLRRARGRARPRTSLILSIVVVLATGSSLLAQEEKREPGQQTPSPSP